MPAKPKKQELPSFQKDHPSYRSNDRDHYSSEPHRVLLSKTGPFVSLPTERFDERGLTRDIHTFPNGAIIPRKIEVAKNHWEVCKVGESY